jgi:hypothetical protein
MRIVKLAVAVAMLAFGVAGSAMAYPDQKFATFQSIGDAPTIQYVQTPGQPAGAFVSTGATTANATIHFLDMPPEDKTHLNFEELSRLSVLGDIPAIMSVTGSGYFTYGSDVLALESKISFLYAGDAPLIIDGVSYNKGANLLTARIALAPWSSNFLAWTYTSDFQNYFGSGFKFGKFDFAEQPVYHDVRYWPSADDYATQISGYFTAGVPEPATWAMMILGFGAVGAMARSRRRLAA